MQYGVVLKGTAEEAQFAVYEIRDRNEYSGVLVIDPGKADGDWGKDDCDEVGRIRVVVTGSSEDTGIIFRNSAVRSAAAASVAGLDANRLLLAAAAGAALGGTVVALALRHRK